jgi:D-arabinose 1-dehydrogenase-like Zn-dependent alcohol dehydrogenase
VTAVKLPVTEYAVQLVGPGQLVLNARKPVVEPGPYEILVKIEAVGLCFSDVKLRNQFSAHPRKGKILSGISPEVLNGFRAYVPDYTPGVPGHEVACRIVAVGSAVSHYRVGERCLVQTDYRTLLTRGSNAAFGYTFEGGLQEYVLLDERIAMDPATGARYLIPVPQSLSAAAVALIEPWSCVEAAYATHDRRAITVGSRLLVVADRDHEVVGLAETLASCGGQVRLTAVTADASQRVSLEGLGVAVLYADRLEALGDESFDDIVYFGASRATIELLNDKLAASGIINIVLGGETIGEPVSVGVGRIHYSLTRWIGTAGKSADVSYGASPASGELRPMDKVLILGAGGAMGQMHVVRNLSASVRGTAVVGTDLDDERLDALQRKAGPVSARTGVPLRLVNTSKGALEERFSYQIILVPSGAMVAAAVGATTEHGLINIFAGIPAQACVGIDLDTYIGRQCYMFGTSGSLIRDMMTMLDRVRDGQIDPNLSVDAISGMEGAIDGVEAVEHQRMSGKIVVYPMLHHLGLVRLSELADQLPAVAAQLKEGEWCVAAERELLRVCGSDDEGA